MIGNFEVTLLQESVPYKYVEDLEAPSASATRPSSFLTARFAEGTLGLPCNVDVLFASWDIGVSSQDFSTERITSNAVPITVRLMIALEVILSDERQEVLMREAAAFVLFHDFSRARAPRWMMIQWRRFPRSDRPSRENICGVKLARPGFFVICTGTRTSNTSAKHWVGGRRKLGRFAEKDLFLYLASGTKGCGVSEFPAESEEVSSELRSLLKRRSRCTSQTSA